MKIAKLFFFTLLALLSIFHADAQKEIDKYWNLDFKNAELLDFEGNRQLFPDKFLTFKIDIDFLRDNLTELPNRFNENRFLSAPIMSFVYPDGSIHDFIVFEAPVMERELALKYPEIKTYIGQGIGDSNERVRFDITVEGFHAMISSPNHSTIFIDPYAQFETEYYISYYKKDYHRHDNMNFDCGVESSDISFDYNSSRSVVQGDCMLRTYRLALACTGEYAQYHGGTVSQVLSAMNTSINRVNGVYETDVDLTMVIVANNEQVIFLNGSTDPYSNGNGSAMLGQNQTTCDNNIGSSNYDIGHVFSTGGGGIAYLNSPCTSWSKAKGVTGSPNPQGDPFDIDYVAHEMGHQYGANHTQNNPCNSAYPASVEPGSASTIMGYAGICPPNVQEHSDAYFHAYSIYEITNNIMNGNSSSCPTITSIGNSAPEIITPVQTFNIPKSTPFVLELNASDSNGDNMLYCWEQMDPESATMPPISTSTSGPTFRSLTPTENSKQYFPNIDAVVNNETPVWEVLPSVTRTMHFRGTVRDNHTGGGCTDEVDATINVKGGSGPFLVSYPNGGETWMGLESKTILWDVAGTSDSPISCNYVDIYLSTDGGYTYPIVVAEHVPNNGSASISVPNYSTSEGRIMVKGNNNIFFDISNSDFNIEMVSDPDFIISEIEDGYDICLGDTITINFNISFISEFNESIEFEVFTNSDNIDIIGVESPLSEGDYSFQIVSTGDEFEITNLVLNFTSPSVFHNQSVVITVLGGFDIPSLLSPVDGQVDIDINANLDWSDLEGSTSYDIFISQNPGFPEDENTFVYNTTTSNIDLFLEPNEVYYWKVRGISQCLIGEFSDIFAFQTLIPACIENYFEPELSFGNQNISWDVDIPQDFIITDINVLLDISHTYVGDLIVNLITPNATINLFDQPGAPSTNFGCAGDDILITLDDEASLTSDDLENMCGGGTPVLEGIFQSPELMLAEQYGTSSQGVWSLEIIDTYPSEDDGVLNNWTLELCGESSDTFDFTSTFNDLIVVQGGEADLTNQHLWISEGDTPSEDIIYTIISLPQFGILTIDGVEAFIGLQFSQNQLSPSVIRFTHDGSENETDAFLVDIVTPSGNWIHNHQQNIIVSEEFVATIDSFQNIDCFGESTGSVTLTATNGLPPYMYSMDGINYSDNPVFEDLPAGNYTFYIQDALGTIISLTQYISQPSEQLLLEVSVDNDYAEAIASGGTSGFQFSIDGGDFAMENTFADLEDGEHSITVIDQNGCQTTVIFTVSTLDIGISVINNITCYGENDGSISIVSIGGLPPYQYKIDEGNWQDSELFSDLVPGEFIAYIMDASGAVSSIQFVISTPDELLLEASTDGNTITAIASGGTPPYQYTIDGAVFNSNGVFEGLSSGDYTITAIDENGCQAQIALSLTSIFSLQKNDFELIVYPNPNNGTFSIEAVGIGTELITTIYDITGQRLNSQTTKTINNIGNQSFNTILAKGVYLIHAKSENMNSWSKVIVY